ncbi:MFS transporter, partial [Bacillus cereus]|nr:MFS transporter [Bacillus cereus]
KLNGSMLFYICASFLLIGGIVQALFVQNLERKKITNQPTHNL